MSGLFNTEAPKGNARGSGYKRNAADWYVESADCVDKLLAVEQFDGLVWDPAAGGGNIPRRCEAAGIRVIGSDLIDRNAGFGVQNFFDFKTALMGADHVLCNPPFQLAQKFVEHALALVPGKVCIVQRLAFLEGQERGRFFARTGLSHVWVHSSRQSMPPGGTDVPAQNGSVAYAWFVWRPARWHSPALRGHPEWTGGFLP